jgi:hypothetical protein
MSTPPSSRSETNHPDFCGLASHIGSMASVQQALFHEVPRLPEGFRYEEEFLSPEEERALMYFKDVLTLQSSVLPAPQLVPW